MDINQLTYKINGAIYELNRVLGQGFLEKVYENALMTELKDRDIKAKNQVPITASYKGSQFGDYYVNIVVENSVILELKSTETLKKVHEAQILNYLKATGFSIGLIVNFTHPKAQIKCFIL